MARSILALLLAALMLFPLAHAALPADAGADACRQAVGGDAALSCGPALVEAWRSLDAGPIAGAESYGGRSLVANAEGSAIVVLSTARTLGGAAIGDFLTGYDALTGAKTWSRMISNDPAYPCAAGSVEAGPDPALGYVAGTCVNAAGGRAFFAAFDIKTGALAWWNADASLASITQVPILRDGLFYAPGPETLKPFGPMGVVVIDGATGATVRHFDLSALGASYSVWLALAVAPDASTLYLSAHQLSGGHGNTTTFALDAGTGALRWSHVYFQDGFNATFQSSSSITADGTRLLVATESFDNAHAGSAAIAYDTATGEVAWERTMVGRLYRWSLAGPDSFYLQDYPATGRSAGDVVRLGGATGDIIFRAPTSGCWCSTTSPWVLSPDGAELYLLQMDAATGAYSACAVDAIGGGVPSCRAAFRPLPDGSGALESMGIGIARDGSRLYATGIAVARDATSPDLIARDAQAGGDPTSTTTVTATVSYLLGAPWALNAAPSAT